MDEKPTNETPEEPTPELEPTDLPMPELDAASVVRSYRQNYVNLYGLFTKATGVPEGVELKTPPSSRSRSSTCRPPCETRWRSTRSPIRRRRRSCR
jgi:hypothetical protein